MAKLVRVAPIPKKDKLKMPGWQKERHRRNEQRRREEALGLLDKFNADPGLALELLCRRLG